VGVGTGFNRAVRRQGGIVKRRDIEDQRNEQPLQGKKIFQRRRKSKKGFFFF
jgi:hypothetical protein